MIPQCVFLHPSNNFPNKETNYNYFSNVSFPHLVVFHKPWKVLRPKHGSNHPTHSSIIRLDKNKLELNTKKQNTDNTSSFDKACFNFFLVSRFWSSRGLMPFADMKSSTILSATNM